MQRGWVGVAACVLLAGCGAGRELPPPRDDSVGVLAGQIGGGGPPEFEVPDSMRLVFTSVEGERRPVTARDGWYEVGLTPGIWNVRSEDGGVCLEGIRVHGGDSVRHDLVWPAECRTAFYPDAP